MAEVKSVFQEVLPNQGQLFVEGISTMVLCKPKLLPLKSLTLEKLEKMQQAAQFTNKKCQKKNTTANNPLMRLTIGNTLPYLPTT
ncbi:BBSome-interacting protein 1-like [Marmota marmota marmota]|uniref:BBSome-interacting protein 1-like n=2 Tax=Marmota TaxID=9992 RepID=UPI0020932EFB|nr:BBSome-interacting protein 1-like [Marmota marmota marmota]